MTESQRIISANTSEVRDALLAEDEDRRTGRTADKWAALLAKYNVKVG